MKNSLLCKCQALFATHSNKKNTTRFNGLLALFLVVIGMNGVVGQVAQFNFPSTNSLVFSTKDANVTVSNLSLSAGTIETNITTGSYFPNEPYIEESGGWTATSQDLAKSFTFTITASSGYIFSITNVSFRGYATSSGPTAFGFTIGSTDIYSVNAPDGSIVAVNQSVSNQTGLTTATIKIKGWLNGSRTSTGGGAFRLDDLIINGSVSSVGGPNITQSGLLNTFISTAVSSPSAEQIFTVAGTTLTNDIVITPPTGYQISTSTGGSFSPTNPITLTQSSGTVATTTIYARFNPTALTDQVGGNIAISTTGATTQNVAVSGEVTNLSAGAIAFIAFQGAGNNTDLYRIVALNDIPNNTRIWFTDKSWDGETLSFYSGEGNNVWTNTTGSTIATGTVIQFGVEPVTTTFGTGGLNSGLGSAGEQLFAYQGTLTSPTFVAGYTSGTVITTGVTTATSTYVPAGLTSGTNFVALGGTYGSSYVTAAIHNRSLADMRSHIHTFANLTTTNNVTTSNSSWPTYTFNISNIWTGASSADWNDATNWNPAAVPTSTDNVVIPTTGITNFPVATSLTIDAGKTVTLNSNSNLTVNGTLTNNGTLTLESGATLVQGTGNTVAGSGGTFNVQQALTGDGGATPSGRFWYLGSPVSGATSTALNAAGANRLWTYSEATQSYTEITTNGVSMLEMQGHVVRLGASETSVFTGGLLNTGNYTSSLTRTGTANTKRGYHLLSNPYPSYLNWKMAYDTAIATNPNISSTIWYRTATSSGNNTMVFNTYNATSNLGVNNSIGGVAPSRYIPPMQSFWVYNPNDGTTGSITFKNIMRSHQANGGGLKDIEDFPAFARLNLVDGDFIDQVVVFTEPNAKNKIDNYDSKKFLLPNKPQVYATVGDEQLVINGLKSGMAKTIVPLTVELPNAQVYTFEMNESYVENGSVILEDTQEGVFQDMGIHTTYLFSGDAGVTANRFVLHFLLPTGNTSDSEDSQVGINDLTNAQIDVINNQQGSILVSISSDLQASGEIQILDAAGSLIQSKTISDHTTALAIKQGAGIYFVRVITPLKSEMKKIFIY